MNQIPKITRSAVAQCALLAFGVSQAFGQIVVPPTNVHPISDADAAKPGFAWRVHQSAAGLDNTLARTEAQLAGLLGLNIADPAAQGIALAPGVAGATADEPITFEISTVINLDKSGAGDADNFSPGDQMPGIPGTAGGSDNIAGEALTWLQLPAGVTTLGVNSDDGFRVTLGGAKPSDRFGVVVGSFDSGRGAADTIFKVSVAEAGLYAARLIWEQGGGGAQVEWFSVDAATNKILINDTAAGSIKAFRALKSTAVQGAVISGISPLPDATGALPNAPITVELTAGSAALAGVGLKIDGTKVTPTVTTVGATTTVKFTPAGLYAPSSKHSAELTYTDGGVARTQAWSFSVAAYATIPKTAKVTPDTTKRGFNWNLFANTANQVNSNDRTEAALSGELVGDDGTALANNADPKVKGAAIAAAVPASPANGVLHFDVESVINFSQAAADEADNKNGKFTPDLQMPGVPQTDGSTDGIAAEITTYLELPAGPIIMGIVSDDGFRTTASSGANPRDIFRSITLGDSSGATADTTFAFVVEEAGVYAFRTIYEEGGGGAHIEWFTVNPNGSRVLINDTANGGVKAFRALTTPTAPYVKTAAPGTVPRQLNNVYTSVALGLVDADGAIDDGTVVLKIDGETVPTTKTRTGKNLKLVYTPTTLQIPGDKHTGEITYTDTTTSKTSTATWNFYNLRNLVLPTAKLTENFDSYAEGSVPTGWVEKNFTRSNDAGVDLDNLNSDAYLGWVVVSKERLTTLKSRIFATVAPGQTVNGVEVTSLGDGNIIYAETDVRGGDQVQFLTTKAFNLSAVTNPVVSFASLYEQNQDNLGAVEYSVDGGTNWLPVVYFLDTPDIKLNGDGSVDAVTTFKSGNADTAAWVDNGVQKGDIYGDGLLAPITAALGPFVVPRINDNPTEGKRVEVYRLLQAGNQADVRLRFVQLGTGSWYFGVDDLAFYDVKGPATVASPIVAAASRSGDDLTVTWTGGNGPFMVQTSTALGAPWLDVVTTANRTVTIPLVGGAGFVRVLDNTTKSVQLFKAHLDSQQEPNKPASNGKGAGIAVLDGLNLTYYVSYEGLGSGVTAAHIHNAVAGVNGAVFVPFVPVAGTTSGTMSGVATLTAAQKEFITTGAAYFNIHTTGNGGGEIRGQILP